jgi:IclR family acetate operon transcriptional repressor
MSQDVPIKAIKNAFQVVEALVRLDSATVGELVSHLDMPQSTVHDYLRTLEQVGYVVKARDSHTYRVSMRFLDIGEEVRQRTQLFKIADPHIHELAEETGERVSLIIEENGLGVLLAGARHDPKEDMPRVGTHNRLHAIAPGKAILAAMPPETVRSVVDRHGLKRYTPSTITTREALFEALETVREQGHAFDEQERFQGLHGVGVPINVNNQVRGALGLYGPTSRLDGERYRAEMPELLKRTANIIEVNMSFP